MSVWEDYFILKYGTMYPNGYNKKWNTSEDMRNTVLTAALNKEVSHKEDIVEDVATVEKKSGLTIDDIIVSDVEKAIIKIGVELEQTYLSQVNQSRITSIIQLKKYYLQGQTEALERPPISGVVLRTDYNKLTEAQRRLVKSIASDILGYNNGKCLWHLSGTHLMSSENLDNVEKYGLKMFNIQNWGAWVTNIGILEKEMGGVEYRKEGIYKRLGVTKDNDLFPIRKLLSEGYLNDKALKIFDAKGKSFDLSNKFSKHFNGDIILFIAAKGC